MHGVVVVKENWEQGAPVSANPSLVNFHGLLKSSSLLGHQVADSQQQLIHMVDSTLGVKVRIV